MGRVTPGRSGRGSTEAHGGRRDRPVGDDGGHQPGVHHPIRDPQTVEFRYNCAWASPFGPWMEKVDPNWSKAAASGLTNSQAGDVLDSTSASRADHRSGSLPAVVMRSLPSLSSVSG